MDLLAVILACSLYPDDQLVRTLIEVQSNGNVTFVGDLATLKTNDSLTSTDAALRFALGLQQHGGRPAVGLLGVPLAWATRYGRAPVDLFDACTNVAVATAAFADYQDRCSRNARRPRPLPAAIKRRRPRRPIAARSHRACVLTSFARELGLTGAPATIIQRLANDRGSVPTSTPAELPPHRSLPFSGGSPNGPPQSPAGISPPIFVDTPESPSTDR